jgi:hypothetical protein
MICSNVSSHGMHVHLCVCAIKDVSMSPKGPMNQVQKWFCKNLKKKRVQENNIMLQGWFSQLDVWSC